MLARGSGMSPLCKTYILTASLGAYKGRSNQKPFSSCILDRIADFKGRCEAQWTAHPYTD